MVAVLVHFTQYFHKRLLVRWTCADGCGASKGINLRIERLIQISNN
jgi:hypothetical protein